jgi:hypothetical protein
LLYGSYLAGTHDDYGYGLALDPGGNLYVAGMTISPDFPTTPGTFDTSYNNYGDAWVAKLNGVTISSGVSVDDSGPGGNGNGYPDPGEFNLPLSISLLNQGSLTATHPNARLTAVTAGITVTVGIARYPDLAPGLAQTNLTPFEFSLDPSLPCGNRIQFRLDVATDQASYSLSVITRLGAPQPAVTVFTDSVESGPDGWTTGGTHDTWGITDMQSHSPTHSWTDSPAGSYSWHTDSWLRSPVLDLTGKTGLALSAWATYQLACCQDFLYLEYSLDGGRRWQPTPLATLARYSPGWVQASLDASPLENQPNARFRYHLLTTFGPPADGVYLDDIALTYTPYLCQPPLPVMHVASITAGYRPRAVVRGQWLVDSLSLLSTSHDAPTTSYRVGSSITVRDDSGLPVPSATVSLTITLPTGAHRSAQKTTNRQGRAVVSFTTSQTGTYTFTVTDVSKTGYTYDPTQNVETSDQVTIP